MNNTMEVVNSLHYLFNPIVRLMFILIIVGISIFIIINKIDWKEDKL